jgi:hypothetical protein
MAIVHLDLGPGELKRENVGVSPLKVNGITKTNPIDQAEALNNQFHSAFTTQTIKTITHLQHTNH